MLVYQAKLPGTEAQYRVSDEMILTDLFVCNKCLRYWMDNRGVNGIDLNKYDKAIADNPEFPWVKKLNLMARQAMSERVWQGISKLFFNCNNKTPRIKGYPKFNKSEKKYIKLIKEASRSLFRRSVEYFGKILGVPFIAFTPDNTSQDCSNCGNKVKNCLSNRTHKCPDCGYADRDYNAAINIVKKAVEIIAQLSTDRQSEINAFGEKGKSVIGETQYSKPTRRKRKPLIAIFGIPRYSR